MKSESFFSCPPIAIYILIVFVEELPGANTQGETIDEARENLKEAVELILKSNLT